MHLDSDGADTPEDGVGNALCTGFLNRTQKLLTWLMRSTSVYRLRANIRIVSNNCCRFILHSHGIQFYTMEEYEWLSFL
jgi:hypothetical protein